uniref:Uncharacterized protein n=1 Tax=Moniliophthora roreri TaxID=221103 RepID=A0A0W0FEN4_MONRR
MYSQSEEAELLENKV